MRNVVAKKDVGAVGGGSQPKRKVLCDDGKVYVAKASADPNGERHEDKKSKEFFNELLACGLANQLGILVPEYAIVKIGDGIVENFAPGLYFGSYFMSDYRPLPAEIDIASTIGDFDEIAVYSLFAFDILLRNPDRKGEDVLRLNTEGVVSPNRLVAIDHANAFTGSHWNKEHLRNNHHGNSQNTKSWLFRGLSDKKMAKRAAKRIGEGIGDFRIVVNDVATSTGLDPDEQTAVVCFLEDRVQNLQQLVSAALQPR